MAVRLPRASTVATIRVVDVSAPLMLMVVARPVAPLTFPASAADIKLMACLALMPDSITTLSIPADVSEAATVATTEPTEPVTDPTDPVRLPVKVVVNAVVTVVAAFVPAMNKPPDPPGTTPLVYRDLPIELATVKSPAVVSCHTPVAISATADVAS